MYREYHIKQSNQCFFIEPEYIQSNIPNTIADDYSIHPSVRYYNNHYTEGFGNMDVNFNQNSIYPCNQVNNSSIDLNTDNFICTNESWTVLLLIPIVLIILGIILGIGLGVGVP